MFLNTERLHQISRVVVMTQSVMIFEMFSSTSNSTLTLYMQYVRTSIQTLTLLCSIQSTLSMASSSMMQLCAEVEQQGYKSILEDALVLMCDRDEQHLVQVKACHPDHNMQPVFTIQVIQHLYRMNLCIM